VQVLQLVDVEVVECFEVHGVFVMFGFPGGSLQVCTSRTRTAFGTPPGSGSQSARDDAWTACRIRFRAGLEKDRSAMLGALRTGPVFRDHLPWAGSLRELLFVISPEKHFGNLLTETVS